MIPSILHFIWVGKEAMPKEQRAFIETAKKLHPSWEICLWNEKKLGSICDTTVVSHWHPAQQSDYFRYRVLRSFGGVYLDCDVEVVKPLDALLEGSDIPSRSFFAGFESDGLIGTAVMGSSENHPVLDKIIDAFPPAFSLSQNASDQVGPRFLARILEDENVSIYPRHYFYPYAWDDARKAKLKSDRFPRSYAIHRWAASWLTEEEKRNVK